MIRWMHSIKTGSALSFVSWFVGLQQYTLRLQNLHTAAVSGSQGKV